MRPTRRGYAVAVIIAAATVAASMDGPRGLDALIVPGVVGFIVGAVQLWWIDAPEVERRLPWRGSRKDEVTVAVDIEVENAVSGRFHDTVPQGLEASGNERLMTLEDTVIEYDLTLSERGEHAVGPLSITVTDVLGLVSVTHSYRATDEILVRPQVFPISVPASDIYSEYGDFSPERGEFDYLREYQPGDPTQDIHWKSSAKRSKDGFLVSEFSAREEGSNAITVAVDALPGHADDTADAAASLLVFLLNAGLETGLRTPSVSFKPGTGADHRNNLLDALARFEPGALRDGLLAEAELHVSGDERGVLLKTGGRTVRFESLFEGDDPESSGSEQSATAYTGRQKP
jgi:uncharacterized protein (DUF58 family)